MIIELTVNNNYNLNIVVDGRAAHTRHQSWQSTPPPYQIMLDPSLLAGIKVFL